MVPIWLVCQSSGPTCEKEAKCCETRAYWAEHTLLRPTASQWGICHQDPRLKAQVASGTGFGSQGELPDILFFLGVIMHYEDHGDLFHRSVQVLSVLSWG